MSQFVCNLAVNICSDDLILTDYFTGCDWTEDTWDCCTEAKPCGLFEGHCKHHKDCLGDLSCGRGHCLLPFPSNVDCCYNPFTSE